MLRNAVGIVSEFNPFHFGHQYLIRKIRESFGSDTVIVCVMSGDFVQRGEAACFSKFARAEAACLEGADLILELPIPWSVSSAEHFAFGAVHILHHLGGVSTLAFGSECGDADRISQTAELLRSKELEALLHSELQENKNFASARQKALARMDAELAGLLDHPNNILGVEYAKAIHALPGTMSLFTVPRIGNGHDQYGTDTIRSAKEIREMMTSRMTGTDWLTEVPPSAGSVYRREIQAGRGPVTQDSLEKAILSRVRRSSLEEIMNLPEIEGGVGELFYNSIQHSGSLNDLMQSVKHKNLALSRIRRLIMASVLGITKEVASAAPNYIRVLAFNDRGRQFLHDADPSLPLIAKPAHLQNRASAEKSLFELGSKAHDLYVLGFGEPSQWGCGEDWKAGPTVLLKGS